MLGLALVLADQNVSSNILDVQQSSDRHARTISVRRVAGADAVRQHGQVLSAQTGRTNDLGRGVLAVDRRGRHRMARELVDRQVRNRRSRRVRAVGLTRVQHVRVQASGDCEVRLLLRAELCLRDTELAVLGDGRRDLQVPLQADAREVVLHTTGVCLTALERRRAGTRHQR